MVDRSGDYRGEERNRENGYAGKRRERDLDVRRERFARLMLKPENQ